MFRYICTVFVALTACQAAFASVAAERKIVTLELAEQTSPKIELFDSGIDSTLNAGDLIMGVHQAGETAYYLNYEYNNNEYVVLHLELHVPLPDDKKIAFVSAKNRDDSNVVICGSYSDLHKSKVVVVLKIPPYTKAKVNFVITAL